MTLRQQIVTELEKTSLTVRDLSQTIRISEKEVIAHLEHVTRSIKKQFKRLKIESPFCHRCGFDFPDRHRFSSPSRCPRCRHEGIQPPRFWIETV